MTGWGSSTPAGNERGVAPVVSILLVVAIALVLVATAGGLVFAFADSTDEPPPVGSFEFEMSDNEAGDADVTPRTGPGADSNLTIRFEGGETFDPASVELVFDEEPADRQDGFVLGASDAPSSGDTLANISGVESDFDGTVEAGDRVTIPFDGDNAVQLVWTDDGSTSVIGGFEGSGPADPSVTLEADDLEPGAETTHAWTLTGVGYGTIGNENADGFDEDGDELDEITVAYPPSTSLTGLDEGDITVSMTRTLAGGLDTGDVSVNTDDYEGFTATFDLSGFAQTDVAGPIELEIDGIENPVRGGEVDITLDGDAGTKTVTGTLPTGTEPVARPDTAGSESTHTWILDDIDFGDSGEDEVDTITAEYPDTASFDGLTDDDITVTMERTLGDGTDTSDISVNSDAYGGSTATFDLSGFATTDVAGPVVVDIDGIENPDAGEYDVEFTLEGDGESATTTGQLDIGDG